MYSKRSWLAFCLLLNVTNTIVTDSSAIDNSGADRIKNIMFHEETGIAADNKNIRYAEAKNLSKDLNIPELVKFFPCQTKMGKELLEAMINAPLSPEEKDVLIERQNIIRALVENPELKQEVEEYLAAAQSHEEGVRTLMSDTFRLQICREISDLEFGQKHGTWLPHSWNEYMTFNPAGWTFSTTLKAAIVAYFARVTAYDIKSIYDITSGSSEETTQYIKEFMDLSKPLVNHGIEAQLATISKDDPGYALLESMLHVDRRIIVGGIGTILVIKYLILSKVYTTALDLRRDYYDACEKKEKLHSLNALITIAEKFENTCIKNNLKNHFRISTIQDSNALELINNVKHARYQDEDTQVFMTPFVHTFIHNVYENDKHLAPIFASIAEMDVYNAIATKIIESQNAENKLCFVTYVDNETPLIKTKSFWNIFVKNPVLNSISESNKIILTGPNAGGKTTAIRALLQNIVLGQTFGIAAAQEFAFTLFDAIHAYLNVSDDLLNGQSLFVSEVKRAQEILHKIKALDPINKKFFFALDELFTGTVAEDGEKCALSFVSNMASFERAQFIYATHFAKLKQLGDETAGCVNYKVDSTTKNAEGKLVYPFTLSKGASSSDDNVGMDIAREAGLFA